MTGESILVVEDNGVIALQIGELLERNGYRIYGTTAFGEEAVAMVEKKLPDLICMDIELMGKIDGIETAQKIHEYANVPIIYLTAYSDSKRFGRAKETGPYNYLVKPFTERELLASVDLALHRHAIDLQLRETMERYRAIVDSAAEGILLVSSETGTIVEANPASIQMLGYTGEELTGMSVGDIIGSPSGQDGAWEVFVFGPEGWSGEVRLRCRDNSLRDADLASRIIHRGGAPVLSCMVVHDITDRKRAEKAILQANKKLNLLSGITRHDINNQLLALQGYLSMLELKRSDPAFTEYFQKAMTAADRISAMIRFTKEYQSIGLNAPAWQDCRTLVENAAKQSLAGNIMLKNDIPAKTEVFADPLIVKVFYNLMDNAVRYGGKITTIRFSVQEPGHDPRIICEDDGDGIPAESKEQIFNRGFGKNTGLGLALSREILDITGITIRETGEPGKGARFEILVPDGSFRAQAMP
jgi:PAS domain S-box-containing protein